SHDLHVLGTPPAFVLSQDQTLQKKVRYKLQKNASISVRNYLCRPFGALAPAREKVRPRAGPTQTCTTSAVKQRRRILRQADYQDNDRRLDRQPLSGARKAPKRQTPSSSPAPDPHVRGRRGMASVPVLAA